MASTTMVAMDVFSEMASVFDIIAGDYSLYYDAIFSALQRRYPGLENAALADIGGGTGLFTFHVCDRVKCIRLLDPSDAMLKMAKEKLALTACHNIEIKKGGFPDCGLDPGSVDLIVILGTFQYLPGGEQPAALRDAYRSLKPGGFLFLDLTNYFVFVGRPFAPESETWHENGLEIVQETRHEVCPFREEWIDTYHVTVENPATGDTIAFESRHVLKMLSPTEMRLLLRETGFTGIDVIPQQDVEKEKAVRLWCFAKKPLQTAPVKIKAPI
jgi:ubiquinone/menaquinone biosynthesis C-methylase UbiE